MHDTLSGWTAYYQITGTAAATLTGLQFIVLTLLASEWIRPVSGGDAGGGIGAFGTPNVVHFAAVLVVSALLCVPWHEPRGLQMLLGTLGAGGLAYAAVVQRRAQRQRSYVPTAYDWIWHLIIPGLAYAALLWGAVRLTRAADMSLSFIASGTLLLICAGIHNAWDTVTYLTVRAMQSLPVAGDSAAPLHREPRKRGRRRHR